MKLRLADTLSLSEERQIWGLFACGHVKSALAAEASVWMTLRSVNGVARNSSLGVALRRGRRDGGRGVECCTHGKGGRRGQGGSTDCDALHFRASYLEMNGRSWKKTVFFTFS